MAPASAAPLLWQACPSTPPGRGALGPSPGPSRATGSLTPPPGLSRLQVSDGGSVQGDPTVTSPQASAFVTCGLPASPIMSTTPRQSFVHQRGRSSTARSLRDLRSPSLAIEEPLRAYGGLASEEHPMSPVAQMVQIRIHSETRSTMRTSAPFPSVGQELGLHRGSCGGSTGPLEIPRSGLRGDTPPLSASAMLQPHATGDMSVSMFRTSLAHALGPDAPASSPFRMQSRDQSAGTTWQGPDYPTCLTVREVARVQAALAEGIVSLGVRLMQLLCQRCKDVRASAPADSEAAEDPQQRRHATEMLTRCQATAQAQLSMSHNMQRWTNVLPASVDLAEDSLSGVGDEGTAVCPNDSLKDAAEELRELACVELRRSGAATGESQLGQGQLVELLLGSGIKPLGKKSLGSVWMHHLGRELVAVKWITIEDDAPGRGYTAAQKQGMLIREVEAMMRLQHPNIVRLLGITTMVTPVALAAAGASSGGRHVPDASPSRLASADSRSSSSAPSVAAAPPFEKATVGIVLELCMYGTLQVRDARMLVVLLQG